MKIFKKLFKKTPVTTEEKTQQIKKEESFDFVERYTLLDPKKVFIDLNMEIVLLSSVFHENKAQGIRSPGQKVMSLFLYPLYVPL